MVVTQFDRKIYILHSDNGGEYFSSSLSTFLDESSIVHQITYLGIPEQNGVVERKNRHILEITRAIMFTMHVPKIFGLM